MEEGPLGAALLRYPGAVGAHIGGGGWRKTIVPFEPIALTRYPSQRPIMTSLKVATKLPSRLVATRLTQRPLSVTVTCSGDLKWIPRTENGWSVRSWSIGWVAGAAGEVTTSAPASAISPHTLMIPIVTPKHCRALASLHCRRAPLSALHRPERGKAARTRLAGF